MFIIAGHFFIRSSIVLMTIVSFNSYSQADIGIPVQVTGSKWNGEICLSDGIRELYALMSPNGYAELFSYSDMQPYRLSIMCQPKTEDCRITSGAEGIVTQGMQPVQITCTPKPPEQLSGMKRNHVWALDENFNSHKFPLLSTVSTDNLGNEYLPPATVQLADANQSTWLGSGAQKPAENLRDFSLIYRTASTILPFSYDDDKSSNFNNWAFIRKLVSFGGDTGAGSHVMSPKAGWVNAAHGAGVQVYGTVFIGQDNAYTGLTDQLLGSSYCTDMYDDNTCVYTIPTIDTLTQLAATLKLDGWFLNIEAGLDHDSAQGRARVEHLKRLMRHKFPEIRNNSNVDFTVYSNLETLGIPGLVTDSMIADFGNVPPNDHGLDNATGLSDSTVASFNKSAPQPYLMYLDEPYTRNTVRNEEHPTVRLASAKQTQCQYFNGVASQTWDGFKEYTLAKYPAGADVTKLLCGGNTSAPLPKRVIKIPLSNATSVTLSNGDTCANDYNTPAIWTKTCMFELDENESNITFSFTGDNVRMANMTGNRYGQSLIPLVGAKWWTLTKESSYGDDYFFDANEYVRQGLTTYDCIAASASSTSCTVSIPPADESWNINAGIYGTPKQLNFLITAQYPSFIWGPRP